jgi:hypothetical protein
MDRPLPSMARARDFYAGEAKTDSKEAFVLADVARAHPWRLVWLTEPSEARAQLELLGGNDADLRTEATRLSYCLRALLATHWPTLERTLGPRLELTSRPERGSSRRSLRFLSEVAPQE